MGSFATRFNVISYFRSVHLCPRFRFVRFSLVFVSFVSSQPSRSFRPVYRCLFPICCSSPSFRLNIGFVPSRYVRFPICALSVFVIVLPSRISFPYNFRSFSFRSFSSPHFTSITHSVLIQRNSEVAMRNLSADLFDSCHLRSFDSFRMTSSFSF